MSPTSYQTAPPRTTILSCGSSWRQTRPPPLRRVTPPKNKKASVAEGHSVATPPSPGAPKQKRLRRRSRFCVDRLRVTNDANDYFFFFGAAFFFAAAFFAAIEFFLPYRNLRFRKIAV